MIQFKRVLIHNFGSYGHTELDLQNRGFCLVSGKNNYTKDNAISNGSGKSFIWSAICHALTGETINGVRTNLKNINIDESDCYTQVEFLYDKDFYCVQRIISPKSDLRIFKNDIDVSGKGIRESEKKLAELLPDLSKDLIASTIIIGQGMPNKFSAFSPSGRKELLEKLTKSDFMIEDVKTRIQSRLAALLSDLKNYDNSLLLNRNQLTRLRAELEDLVLAIEQQQQLDFNNMISALEQQLSSITQQQSVLNTEIADLDTQIETLSNKQMACSEEKLQVSNEELAAYTASYTALSDKQVAINSDILSTERELTTLRAITDTCPTCRQKLPHVHKPDTSALEARLQDLITTRSSIEEDVFACNQKHKEYIQQIDNAFKSDLTRLANELSQVKTARTEKLALKQRIDAEADVIKTAYNKAYYDRQNAKAALDKLITRKAIIEAELARVQNIVSIAELSRDDLNQRLAVVRKMESLTKRDFRGYLLTNIISYIERKAQEYCNTVFNTKDLTLSLNGNSLDIAYCGRSFDGLSGGEKQRVDLILQLAIRDLLTTYLNLSANILVLDEITDFLDKRSCTAVMKLLETELKDIESVFIISHHTDELELPIDSEIQIIKNEHGISEIY